MGLRKVFAVSIISGISLGFSYQITGELMGGTIGFVILNWFSQNLDSSIQVLVIIISLVISIVSIYGMSIFIRQVYEQRFFGIITASLGFSNNFSFVFSINDLCSSKSNLLKLSWFQP